MGICCSLCWQDTIIVEETNGTNNTVLQTPNSVRTDIKPDNIETQYVVSKIIKPNTFEGIHTVNDPNSLDNLVNKLVQEYSSDTMNLLLTKLNNQYLTLEQCNKLWEKIGDKLINKIKKQPELAVSFKLQDMNNTIKNNYIRKIGILLYENHTQEATVLLYNHLDALAILLRKTNKRGAELLLDNNINKGFLLDNADNCAKCNKWGIAYILYKKCGNEDSAKFIINKHAPEYINKLLGYN